MNRPKSDSGVGCDIGVIECENSLTRLFKHEKLLGVRVRDKCRAY